MTKSDFLTYVYKNHLVERWGRKQLQCIPATLRKDVIQEVFLLFMEYDDEKYYKLASQGFEHLTAFARRFTINTLMPNGKSRNLINLFKNESSEEDFENNLNDKYYEE